MSTGNPADEGFHLNTSGMWVRHSYELPLKKTECHAHTIHQRKRYKPETIDQAVHHLETVILNGMDETEKQAILLQFKAEYDKKKGTDNSKNGDILLELLNQYRTSEYVIVSTFQGFRS